MHRRLNERRWRGRRRRLHSVPRGDCGSVRRGLPPPAPKQQLGVAGANTVSNKRTDQGGITAAPTTDNDAPKARSDKTGVASSTSQHPPPQESRLGSRDGTNSAPTSREMPNGSGVEEKAAPTTPADNDGATPKQKGMAPSSPDRSPTRTLGCAIQESTSSVSQTSLRSSTASSHPSTPVPTTQQPPPKTTQTPTQCASAVTAAATGKREDKAVHFNQNVRVRLIPTRREMAVEGTLKDICWSPADFRAFREDFLIRARATGIVPSQPPAPPKAPRSSLPRQGNGGLAGKGKGGGGTRSRSDSRSDGNGDTGRGTTEGNASGARVGTCMLRVEPEALMKTVDSESGGDKDGMDKDGGITTATGGSGGGSRVSENRIAEGGTNHVERAGGRVAPPARPGETGGDAGSKGEDRMAREGNAGAGSWNGKNDSAPRTNDWAKHQLPQQPQEQHCRQKTWFQEKPPSAGGSDTTLVLLPRSSIDRSRIRRATRSDHRAGGLRKVLSLFMPWDGRKLRLVDVDEKADEDSDEDEEHQRADTRKFSVRAGVVPGHAESV